MTDLFSGKATSGGEYSLKALAASGQVFHVHEVIDCVYVPGSKEVSASGTVSLKLSFSGLASDAVKVTWASAPVASQVQDHRAQITPSIAIMVVAKPSRFSRKGADVPTSFYYSLKSL